MRTLRTGIAVIAVWACTCLPVLAQEGIAPYLEYAKRIEAARRLSALETGLFGEQVSLYSGGTEFSVTDIRGSRQQRPAGAAVQTLAG